MRIGLPGQIFILFLVTATATIPIAAQSSAAIAAGTFTPGNLVLSRSVYVGTASTVTVGQPLPPNCPAASGGCTTAVANGTYPNVFNNAGPDGSFGVTSPIYLDQITTGGQLINTLDITDTLLNSTGFNLCTSFSSKSELALNLSTDGTVITFMGYNAPVNTLDVSNANTPGVVDPTNPVGENVYRVIAQVDANGNITTTETNAYSGNNGRAAIYAAGDGSGVYFAAGNDNNGNGTPANLVDSTGIEIVQPGAPAGVPQQVGQFSITQYGYTADKAGKDNNFRGLTIFNNTLYATKGSGSNGINTVYQIGNAGSLPTLQNASLTTPIIVLPGFPTSLAKTTATAEYPFGLFFANANTLYVADEGDGKTADASTNPNSGLQKWVFNGTTWNRVYVLQNGLGLGVQYGIPGYPSALNPATDGLRNITGRVNSDGTVTIWAITSTISASGDQGADPNELVVISDVLANTDPNVAANESFGILRTANYGEVLRGIAFTPGTTSPAGPSNFEVSAGGIVYSRATHSYSSLITVTNNQTTAASGPLSVVLSSLPQGVTLTNETSTYHGLAAVQVLGASGALNPGASVSVVATFSDPSGVAITFTPSVVNQ